MLTLGTYVIDTVTDIEGTITAITNYLNGSIKCFIETKVDEMGNVYEYWIDIKRLKEI